MAQETMRDRETVMGDAGGAVRNAIAETLHDARGGMPAHRELTLGAKNGGNAEKDACLLYTSRCV